MTESPYASTPTLMRGARGAYARSIRARLHAAGISDLPRNGVLVLAGIDPDGGPRPDLPSELGVTKQAVSQVIDILVARGYLERSTDAGDRRRIALELTDRGQQVVDLAGLGIDAVDEQLHERLPAGQVEAMRAGLAALAEIKLADEAAGTSRRRPERQLRRLSPVFGVRDLAAALAHYAALGFDAVAHEDGDDYGFARRDGVGLHLAVGQNPGVAYLYVRDADDLHEEWSRPGVGGETGPVATTEYEMREAAHTDPDGNVIRFGSPLPE